MAKAKGSPKTGGRKAGTPNKATATAREAMALLADGKAEEMATWLDMGAYGVGQAFTLKVLPHDAKPPADAWQYKALKDHIVWAIPASGSPTISLRDIMEGRIPDGALVKWIVPPDPGESTRTMLAAMEYHLPKLSRIEATGADGKDLIPEMIQIVGVAARPQPAAKPEPARAPTRRRK